MDSRPPGARAALGPISALVVLMALLAMPSGAAASSTRSPWAIGDLTTAARITKSAEVKTGAMLLTRTLDYDGGDHQRCSHAVFIQVAPVSAATGYTVTFYDSLYGSEYSRSIARPFPTTLDGWEVPSGAVWLGPLTGGSGPAPCPSGVEQRFRIVSAVATVTCATARLTPGLRSAQACGEATVWGHVRDSFGEGVGNVKIRAKPPGKPAKTLITDPSGEFTFTFAKPSNKGSIVVTPEPLADQRITPKSANVTVRPGKKSFVKFEAEVGVIQGEVNELICPAPVSRENCGRREPRAGAVVELRGKGVRKPKFATSGDAGYRFVVPPGAYEVLVNRLAVDVPGNADICEEDKRLPLVADSPSARTRPAECAAAIVRTGGRESYRGREIVRVRALRRKQRQTVDFVAVPHRAVPAAELVSFRGGKASTVTEVRSGLASPEKQGRSDPRLFGPYGPAGRDYDPALNVIQCRTGCAPVNVRVTNLLGEPLKGAQLSLSAGPITPAENAVGLADGSPTNMTGQMCVVKRNRAGDCDTSTRGRTDKAGRVLGLYAPPGVVDGHALPGPLPDAPIGTVVGVLLERQAVPGRGDYPEEAFTAEPLGIRPNPRVQGTKQFTPEQLEFLSLATNPDFVAGGMNAWPPDVCERIVGFMANLLYRTMGRGFSVSLPEKFELNLGLCEVDVGRDGVPRRRPVPESVALTVDAFFQAGAVSLTLLDLFGVDARGVNTMLGISTRGTDIRLGPAPTPLNTSLAGFVRQRREARGGTLRAEPITLEIYEVSRLAAVGLVQRAQPALYLHLGADGGAGPSRTTLAIGAGYDPARWLR